MITYSFCIKGGLLIFEPSFEAWFSQLICVLYITWNQNLEEQTCWQIGIHEAVPNV